MRWILLLGLTGCIRIADPLPTDQEIGALAAGYDDLIKINPKPYQTTRHADRPFVTVWANPTAAATYETLTLESPRPVAFAEGALLVKETFLADGTTVLAVRYKMPRNYDPKHGDWWYGMLRNDGTPLGPDATGRVAGCNGCHLEAAVSDHSFGIPAAAH